MGQQFDDVRVYESHSATMLGAEAYSHGRDIFFAPGHFQPHSEAGERLIAHELTHVVQQGHPQSPALAENLVQTEAAGATETTTSSETS